MKIGRVFRPAFLWLLVPAAYMFAAGPPDWHLSSGPGQALFAKSAFVHGYMHGYEQGFHCADLDLQMGHAPRDPATIKDFKNISGYRDVFGDKHSFTNGYREGFRVGYADSTRGSRFRAVGELRAAALGLPENAAPAVNQRFDQGVSTGYYAGRQQGLRDGRAGNAFQEVAVHCGGGLFHPFRRSEDEFCAGYGRGYNMGYADGYANQAPRAVAERRK